MSRQKSAYSGSPRPAAARRTGSCAKPSSSMWNEKRSTRNKGRTRLPRGPIIRQLACTSLPRKPTPGWTNSKRVRTPLPRNATIEVVPVGSIGRRPSPLLSRTQEPGCRQACGQGDPAGSNLLGKHPEVGRPVEELPPEFREWVIDFGAWSLCRPVPLRRETDCDPGGPPRTRSRILS